jgi:putative DNA primase/helicase
MTVLDWARRYLRLGLSVIPVRADGSKAPAISGWREFTDRRPTEGEVVGWFPDDRHGIGVVPGPASGNLVVLDFECKGGVPAFSEWLQQLNPKFAAHLATCPVVRTPSGGRHVWVRLTGPAPGCRLARYAKGATKVEVRGAGHQVLAPGCPAKCHKSGDPYVFEAEGWVAE